MSSASRLTVQRYAMKVALRRGMVGTGPIERHAAVAQRDVRVVADHEVVQQVDVQEAPGRERFRCEVQIIW